MRRLRSWVIRLFNLLRSDHQEHELAHELDAHLELHIDDNLRAGMTPSDARRAAIIGLGGVESLKERCRDVGRARWVEGLWQDIRYGLRKLRDSPGFTIVAVLTLGLGIGANTALIGVLHSMLVERLPVRVPDELVVFRWMGPNTVTRAVSNWGAVIAPEGEDSGASFPLLAVERFEEVNETLTQVFAVAPGSTVNFLTDGIADAASSQYVTGQFYAGLGVVPSAGRLLQPDDDRVVDLPVVLSHAYWNRRFGRDESIVGRAVAINGLPATVIGVEPEGLDSVLRVGIPSPDLTIPATAAERLEGDRLPAHPNYWRLLVMGRLRRGISADQAQANFAPAFREAALEVDAATVRTPGAAEAAGVGTRASSRAHIRQPRCLRCDTRRFATAAVTRGRVRHRIAHCVRQSRYRHPIAYGVSPKRGGRAPGDRRESGQSHATADHREYRAGHDGWRHRAGRGVPGWRSPRQPQPSQPRS